MQNQIRKLSFDEIQSSKPSIEEVKNLKRMPFVVVLDNIRSLYNVGAIFRTSDAVLVEKVILCGITGKPPRKEIAKVALGACEIVPWEYYSTTREAVLKLKENGYKIVALELTDPMVDYRKYAYDFPVAIILGNEVEGVSDDVMDLIDNAVAIPMLGRANSLNVATAYGVMVYELLYQFKNK